MVWCHIQFHYFLFTIIPCGSTFNTSPNSANFTKCLIASEVNIFLNAKQLNS